MVGSISERLSISEENLKSRWPWGPWESPAILGLKHLVYHDEINGGEIEKANGAIGIVPYTYQKAYNYYYVIWEAQQKNKDKEINQFVPKVKEIIIPIPEKKSKKRKLFSFLDEEDNNAE